MGRLFCALVAALMLTPAAASAEPISITIATAAISGALAASSTAVVLGLSGAALGAAVAASSLALGFISKALAPKPKLPNFSDLAVEASGTTQQSRQPITAWRLLYGEKRVSGPVTFMTTTGNNKYLHFVITLGCHEFDQIGTIQINDEAIFADQLDGDGNVTTGRFANRIKIQKDLGTAVQPFPDLVTEAPDWLATHLQSGHSKLWVRLQFDPSVFESGRVNISAWCRGMKVLDTRTSVTAWSPNPAMCIRDYFLRQGKLGGFGAASGAVDATFFEASANIDDEFVATQAVVHTVDAVDTAAEEIELAGARLLYQTGDRVEVASTGGVPGGLAVSTSYYVICVKERVPVTIQLASSYDNALAGTPINLTSAGSGTITVSKTGEPRYTLNGLLSTDKTPKQNIDDMLTACGGRMTRGANGWRLRSAAFTAPAVTLDESHIRSGGSISVSSKIPKRERFNAVKGLYVSPQNDGQPSDYPAVTSAAFEAEDGSGQKFLELNLPCTTRAHTAMRLGKIEMMRARGDQTTVDFQGNLACFQAAAAGTVSLDNTQWSWTGKTFEVATHNFIFPGASENPIFGVDLGLTALASSAFDWDSSEETAPAVAPTITTPTTTVAPPTGLTLTTGTPTLFLKGDGTVLSRIKAAWAAAADEFVTAYEVQYKQSAAGTFEPSKTVTTLEDFIWDVEDGVTYDVRVRSIRHFGGRSAWVSDSITAVGKSADPSDVASLTVNQNGALVVFKWPGLTDADLAAYDLRLGPRGNSSFADGSPLDPATRTEQITTASVPPGDWTFYIKARDTSGNRSANAASADLVVANTFDVIAGEEQAPRWAGTLTNFVKHSVSGCLLPASTKAANAHTKAELWEQFVPYPEATCSYEAPELDLTFDADGVRVHAEIVSALGPGIVAGIADPDLQIDYRDEADAYDGFETWIGGMADFRRLKARAVLDTSRGVAKLQGFKPIADVEERSEKQTNVAIDAGGTDVAWLEAFHLMPSVHVTGLGGLIPDFDNADVSTTQLTGLVLRTGAGVATTGACNVTATGA